MGRPPDYEWAVLDESEDPIPGNPDEVREEAKRLGSVGQTIRDQIRLLKDIAGDENRGKFADKLISTADDLRGDLEKVAVRYEKVSGYLGNWATDLEYCQSESLRALAKAQEVAPQANAPEIAPAPGSPQPHLTPDQQQHQLAAAKAKEAAQGELDDAKRQLANAKQHRDDRGHYWMQKIEDTEHDGLKDHGFGEWISNFIHDHADTIKLLADVCTWIVTALVIVSLFIPGLDIATGFIAAGMLAAAAGHTALAINGDGSWTDVALDAFAILTLSAGVWVKAALKGSAQIAEALGATLRGGTEAEEGATAAVKAGSSGADLAESSLQNGFSRVTSAVSDWGKAVGQKFMAGGEKSVVESMEKLNKFAEEFPNTRLGANVVNRAGGLVNAIRVINGAANVADEFGHWAGGSDMLNWGFGHHFAGGPLEPELEGGPVSGWSEVGKFKELTTTGVPG